METLRAPAVGCSDGFGRTPQALLGEPQHHNQFRNSESRSFSRFHDAPQALFGLFGERTGRAVARADVFSATAARMSAWSACSSILSPS